MEVTFITTLTKQEVIVFADMVCGVTILPVQKTVALVMVGGGTIPVEGTKQEALEKVKSARGFARSNTLVPGGTTDGI